MLINMKELLEVASRENFAVPAFNISSLPMLNGVMETCEKENSPVIIAIHPDELSYTGDSFVEAIKDYANKVKIPVVIHLDHGANIDQVIRAINDGFTSVMIDSSLASFEDNIAITKEVVKLAHAVDISVEAELGTIGSTDSTETKYEGAEIIYTKTEDAIKFVEETGCDTIAIAIGTAHGLYPEGFDPHLKLDLLSEINENVSIPLVLHGGSSNPDSEIAEAVERGINKINISSDIKSAFYQKCREVLSENNYREPNQIYPPCIKAMNEVVEHKIHLFKSNDKADLYVG
jgi:ketose-bisphosphate aldolase, class II